jgi:predicted AlkP superfamily pyrophosphatase or phosphodiesterase
VLGLGCDDPASETSAGTAAGLPRVLIIGLDGADLRWLDRLAGEGRLPHLSALVDSGVSGPLATVHNSSPIIWTSIATGVKPARHGILSFLAENADQPTAEQTAKAAAMLREMADETSARRPVTAAERLRPAFWNILTHYDHSVGVMAWWATYPAERVNGYVLSPYLLFQIPSRPGTARVDVDWSSDDPRKAYPPDLGEEVRPMMYKASDIAQADLVGMVGAEGQTPYTPWVVARDRSYYEAALHLIDTRPVECVAVYLQGIDVASHDYTYFVYGRNVNKRRRRRVSPSADAAAYARVEAVYEHIDGLVGGLLRAAGEGTDVIIVSDHGWEYDGTSHWNLDPGVFIAAGPSFNRGVRVEDVSVVDVAPLVLALFDVPVARAFDGRVPPGVLRGSVEEQVSYVDDYPIPAVALDPSTPTDTAEDEEERMLELLEGLGYIE